VTSLNALYYKFAVSASELYQLKAYHYVLLQLSDSSAPSFKATSMHAPPTWLPTCCSLRNTAADRRCTEWQDKWACFTIAPSIDHMAGERSSVCTASLWRRKPWDCAGRAARPAWRAAVDRCAGAAAPVIVGRSAAECSLWRWAGWRAIPATV